VTIIVFHFLYDNYRIVDLPLHSVWTWITSLLLVEFVYYWTHRALHEFNILWGAHNFHHMAEDINITTTIRDSVVDLVIYDVSIALFKYLKVTLTISADISDATRNNSSATTSITSHAIQFNISNLVT
jgi:alkylglycerol monooxygenase